jgi:tRNA(Arg) A34 adenosine deaminase TadA
MLGQFFLFILSMKMHTKTMLSAISLKQHELAMREAIKVAAANPAYLFGAVITNGRTGQLMALGVNASRSNPTFHGEMVCINHYVQQHGNSGWGDLVLYTTGEPCPMCMSALTWAGIGGVVYASSIASITRAGIRQINLSAQSVIDAADFHKPELLGGVLETECDALFIQRNRT